MYYNSINNNKSNNKDDYNNNKYNLSIFSISKLQDKNNNNKNNLTILMVSTEYPPMLGGVGRYTYNLTRALRKLGNIVYVVCNENGDGDFFGLYPFNKNNSELLLKIVDKVKPDIVHIQFEHGLYGLKLNSINPRNTCTTIDTFYDICEIPIVTTFHSAFTFKQWMSIVKPLKTTSGLLNQLKSEMNYLFQYWKFLINYKSFHNLNNDKLSKSKCGIVFSEYLQNLVNEKRNNNQHTYDNKEFNTNIKNSIIYHGAQSIVPVLSEIKKEEARTKFGLPIDKTKRIALAIGFRTVTKGWDILKKINVPANWLIVINSSKNHYNIENYKPELITKNKSNHTTKIIDIQRDFLSEKDLSLLFYASDVILLPYEVSSGSGVMFDALAHGLPFIATDLQFFNEFARKGLGITVKRNPCEFAKALNEMENNYHFYSKAVNKFRLNLEWDTVANQHNELYLDILKCIHSTKKNMQPSSTTIAYSNNSKMKNK
ncbi:MAG TPA: glycosyltransferase [Nitrososphaeraceae archaeon]|nr:glycosyltransferase [Nitrososphaeraceae archaeon]